MRKKTFQKAAVLVPWIGYWMVLNADDDLYYLIVPGPDNLGNFG